MASGRMLQRKISQSHDVARLIEVVSDTMGLEHGPFAGLLFTWCLAHQDVAGRMHGDPRLVKGQVFPLIEQVNAHHVGGYLRHMHDLKLVVWYEVEGRRYLEFPKFEDNQPGLRKDREQPSIIPAPNHGVPVNAGALPADCRSNSDKAPAEVEEKIKRSRSEVKSIADPDGPASGFDFESVYALYPRKEGKSNGLRRWKRAIKTQANYDAWCSAVKNYAAHVAGRATEHVKQFDSFMSVWEEYVDFKPSPQGDLLRPRSAIPPREAVTEDKTGCL